jgi:hypothetical protein
VKKAVDKPVCLTIYYLKMEDLMFDISNKAFADTIPTIHLSEGHLYKGCAQPRPSSADSVESSEQLRFLGWIKNLHT